MAIVATFRVIVATLLVIVATSYVIVATLLAIVATSYVIVATLTVIVVTIQFPPNYCFGYSPKLYFPS